MRFETNEANRKVSDDARFPQVTDAMHFSHPANTEFVENLAGAEPRACCETHEERNYRALCLVSALPRIPLLRGKRGEDNGSRGFPWGAEKRTAGARGAREDAWRK